MELGSNGDVHLSIGSIIDLVRLKSILAWYVVLKYQALFVHHPSILVPSPCTFIEIRQ
jgi:hypothetical protein